MQVLESNTTNELPNVKIEVFTGATLILFSAAVRFGNFKLPILMRMEIIPLKETGSLNQSRELSVAKGEGGEG